jgi:putative Holliday junction resolvase
MPERGGRLVLAFDFGLRRIGIAAGDTISATAAPRPAVHANADGPDWNAIERQIAAIEPQQLIVGRPLNADGSAGRLGAAADRFAAALAARTGLPVARIDERWSSLEAAQRLKERRAAGTRRRRVRRADIDSAAAAIILERWLRGEKQ